MLPSNPARLPKLEDYDVLFSLRRKRMRSSANLAAKNRETMATLETENARRNAGGAKIVKPSGKSVKPETKEASK